MPIPFSRRTEHPYRADNLTDIPAGLRPLAEQSLLPDETVDLIFVIPEQTVPKKLESGGGMQCVPAQALLFTVQRVVHILGAAAGEQPAQVVSLRGEHLLYTRLALILLYGRLEFCGVEGNALIRIVVEYNTVAHDLLHPALLRFLRLAWGLPTPVTGDDQTDDLLRQLNDQSFKFRNGLRLYALQSDERLIGFIFQPRITWRFFGIFQRLLLPTALLALTESELIVIEEGRGSADSYGWYITYCPRICVAGVDTRPNAEWQDVCIHLSKGSGTAERQVTMESANALAWQNLWSSHAQ